MVKAAMAKSQNHRKSLFNEPKGIGGRRQISHVHRNELKQNIFQGNRFAPLGYNIDEVFDSNETNPTLSTPTIRRPPPIVVDKKHKIKEIQETLSSTGLKFKHMSTGTKIFSPTKEDYDNAITQLKSKNLEFYTHRMKEDRQFKVFLYGLPLVNVQNIIDDLKTLNMQPHEVKEIKTKFSSEDNAAYTVTFKKSSITMRELRKVRFICRTQVHWKQYKPRDRNNPTLCWKCLMYGHGGENCHRSSACMTCASTEHLTKDCNFDKEETAVKCFNCIKNNRPANHKANDVKCPSRSEYIAIRTNAQQKVRRQQPQFNLNPLDFPSHLGHIDESVSFQKPTTSGATYSQTLLSNKNDLFSMEELFDIFQSAVQELNRCQTKNQQMKVIVSLLQYAV